MTRVMYRAEVFKDGDVYAGLCPELSVSSFGDSPQEATDSLQEAVLLFLDGLVSLGTLEEVLDESGFELVDGNWRLRERISEVQVATVS